MSAYLIASLALNLVLAVLFLFKSAINDILKSLFQSRHEAKERRKDLLRQLHAKVETFTNYYFLWLSGSVIVMRARTVEESNRGTEISERNGRDMGPILDFMRNNRFEFPESIQGLRDKFFSAAQVGVDFFQPTSRYIDQKIEQVGLAVEQLKAAIRKELDQA